MQRQGDIGEVRVQQEVVVSAVDLQPRAHQGAARPRQGARAQTGGRVEVCRQHSDRLISSSGGSALCRPPDFIPWSSSSLKNSSLSLAEWDFFISALRCRGTLRRNDGEKKEGRFRSGVGGVLKEVT